MELTSVTLQIFLAIVLVIVLGVIGVLMYNWENVAAIRRSMVTRKEVPIFLGVKDLKNSKNETYITASDRTNPNFRDVDVAVNQPGGAEFTYNFWLYVASDIGLTAATNTNDVDSGIKHDQVILFVRGSKTPKTFNNLCSTTQVPKTKTDIYAKCPLVKLENAGKVLSVEFNTVASPDVVVENAQNLCENKTNDWDRKNSYKVGINGINSLSDKWNMISVVIQDTNQSDPLPMRNKVRCRIFINGRVQLDKYVDGRFISSSEPKPATSILKQNSGHLYVAPDVSEAYQLTSLSNKKLMMADLTYFNYAMDTKDISNLYKNKFNAYWSPAYSTYTITSSITPGTISSGVLNEDNIGDAIKLTPLSG